MKNLMRIQIYVRSVFYLTLPVLGLAMSSGALANSITTQGFTLGVGSAYSMTSGIIEETKLAPHLVSLSTENLITRTYQLKTGAMVGYDTDLARLSYFRLSLGIEKYLFGTGPQTSQILGSTEVSVQAPFSVFIGGGAGAGRALVATLTSGLADISSEFVSLYFDLGCRFEASQSITVGFSMAPTYENGISLVAYSAIRIPIILEVSFRI